MEGSPGDQASIVDTNGVPRVITLQAGTAGPVDASTVTYTPGNPSVWPIPPPATVADALDLLAALRGTLLTNAVRSPAAGEASTAGLSPASVLPTKSGVYLAWASVEFQGFAAPVSGQADLTLLVDSVAQGQPLGSGFVVGAWATTFTQLSLVTVNRTLFHNWELSVNTNDVTATGHINAQHAKLLLLEL
jgi:hypothetical protein